MSSINQFLAQFTDLARQNMFRVRIAAPWMDSDFLSFMCFSAKSPFQTFTQAESSQNKQVKKFSTKENFDPVALQFYVDNNGRVIEFMRTWMQRVRSADYQWNFKNEYTATVTIEALDARENPYFITTLVAAQPVNVDLGEWSWQSPNTLQTATLNLIYDDIRYG